MKTICSNLTGYGPFTMKTGIISISFVYCAMIYAFMLHAADNKEQMSSSSKANNDSKQRVVSIKTSDENGRNMKSNTKKLRIAMIGTSGFSYSGGLWNLLESFLIDRGYLKDPNPSGWNPHPIKCLSGGMVVSCTTGKKNHPMPKYMKKMKEGFTQMVNEVEPWDVVVVYDREGYFPGPRTGNSVLDNQKLFCNRIREKHPNCRIVVMPWPYCPIKDGALIKDKKVEKKRNKIIRFQRHQTVLFNVAVCPKTHADVLAYQERPGIRIYESDKDHHPHLLGQYLQACLVFEAITGESPVGLPTEMKEKRVPFSIDAADGRFIQRIAHKAWEGERAEQKKKGYGKDL
jgi:hypothetical protein